MAGHNNHIKRIEEKVALLASRMKLVSKESEKLKKENQILQKENEALKKHHEQLMFQMALMKSDTDSKSPKTDNSVLVRKLNDYIREIDRCIALLGEND
jgi:predicted RNase H-like nuclease (RuvC/YqgF family)